MSGGEARAGRTVARVSSTVLSALLALGSCADSGAGGRTPSGSGRAESCDPTATSDNGCADGMACSLLEFDEARGEHVARCEPGGPGDQGQSCGAHKRCRAGHICKVVPNHTPEKADEPGTCFRVCNIELPLCPGSSCSQLTSPHTQWLTVEGVRYGICGVGEHPERM